MAVSKYYSYYEGGATTTSFIYEGVSLVENKLPEGPFNLTCQVEGEGIGLHEQERIVPQTDREWYLVLNGKLKLMGEIQNKTFTMLEKYERENEITHREIIVKVDALPPKIDSINTLIATQITKLHGTFVPNKPFYFILSVLVLVLGFFFVKTAGVESWITKHETEYKIIHPPRIEQKSDIIVPHIPTQ
jgi:hypothetical protein